MYDDGHVYTDKAGSFKNAAPVAAPVAEAKAEKAPESKSLMHKKHHHHKHGNGGNQGRDTFDHDPDTTSMYDDQHIYSRPGEFKGNVGQAPNTKGKADETDTSTIPIPVALNQARMRDTFDKDPTSTSMYDDGHVYTDHAGTLKWKFAGGPAAEYKAATGHEPFALVQRVKGDTFDHDPDTAAMYDDQHVYSKPGQYTASMPASAPKKQADAPAKATTNSSENPEKASLIQKKSTDTFDVDDKNEAQPSDASVYDD
jgi:hypothetical protein